MTKLVSGIITRANESVVPFSCSYSRSGLETSLNSFQPEVKSVVQAQESKNLLSSVPK